MLRSILGWALCGGTRMPFQCRACASGGAELRRYSTTREMRFRLWMRLKRMRRRLVSRQDVRCLMNPISTKAKRRIISPVKRKLPAPVAVDRLCINLNQGWRFQRSGADMDGFAPGLGETVNLPHSVRLDPLDASGGR